MSIFLIILRAVFVLLMAAIGWKFVVSETPETSNASWLAVAIALSVGVLSICIDILAPSRRKLALFAGTFFGLIVGVIAGYAMSFVVDLVIRQLTFDTQYPRQLSAFLQLLTYCTTTYFSISFIMQTKDDFRFIVPYVEFRKQTRGIKPILLDTSSLIDGRIASLVETGIFESQMVVPRFVLQELQTIADSNDRLKRSKARRGLDVLAKLQQHPRVDLITYETGRADPSETVDQRIMNLAKDLQAKILTTDYNLSKVAQLAGIDIVNINELASHLKPDVLPGEKLSVRIIKPGESPGQGVGYLDDGTMVVVEQARSHLNEEIEFSVTNTVQTSAGKMIFGRFSETVTTRRTTTSASD